MFKVDENHLNRLSVEQLRQEVCDYAGRWIELQAALRELPELPSHELLHVLGDFARWPADHERGKAIQRRLGSSAVPPVSECEGGAGWWTLVREALQVADKSRSIDNESLGRDAWNQAIDAAAARVAQRGGSEQLVDAIKELRLSPF